MGVRGRSVVLFVTAAFLAGGVAGVFVGTGWSPPPAARAPNESTGVDGRGAGVAQTQGRAPRPSGRSDPEPTPGREAPSLAAGAGSGTARKGGEVLATGTATLVVQLRGAESATARSAIAYAVPAGGPGGWYSDGVPHGPVGSPIPVPAPANYDVGVRFDLGGAEFALTEDVRVEAGTTLTVQVTAAARPRRAIHLRATAGSLQYVPPGSRLVIFWSRTGIRTQAFPGRRDALEERPVVTTTFDPRVETDTVPLSEDGPWVATGAFETPASVPGGGLEVDVIPRIARPGDTVEVRVEATAVVRAVGEIPPGGWPPGTGPLHLVWDGSHRPIALDVRDLEEVTRGVPLRVTPGKGRLSWSGPGIRSGVSEPVEPRVGSEAETVVEVRLEPDPSTVLLPERLTLRMRGGLHPVDADHPCWVAVRRDVAPVSSNDIADVAEVGSYPEEPVLELGPTPVNDVFRLAAGQGDRASEPVTVRSGGAIDVELRPAGYLVVLPGEGTQAVLTIAERIEGGVIPYVEGDDLGGPPLASTRVRLTAGRVLGPFPEGPLRLRLRRGGIAVAELTVTVRAGAFEPLRLPR